MSTIQTAEHPLLQAGIIHASFPSPLGELPSPESLQLLLTLEADVPLKRSEECRKDVRNLLRHGGYKPTGRGKPASEFLVRAAGEGKLSSINLAVDICNVVSLHSGLPISVVDPDRAVNPLSIAIAGEGTSYVFNASAQEIRLDGLLCLFDSDGPCANSVKDCQRTKTDDTTRNTISVIWGTTAQAEQTVAAIEWYQKLLEQYGATDVRVDSAC
ncbi:MAG: DNA/RNA-binding domain of Phe-tRNA-synthetase-like protein [Planctomycetota bacterium]|jgi:DNA/RNA-binding domain of Phe-tRNA-synthetase-like protein